MKNGRNTIAKGWTFARLIAQQLRARGRIDREIKLAGDIPFTFEAPTLVLTADEPDWRASSVRVRAGERFRVSARGAIWLSRQLSVVVEPRSTLWLRISGAPGIEKPADNDHVFTAWADGEVELFLKALSEWASPSGELLSRDRAVTLGEIRVRVAVTEMPASQTSAPLGWRYLWRLGDGTIYSPGANGEINIQTHGDVGILQVEVDHLLTPDTQLEWSWRVDELPSRLPEDTQLTHDYLSVAVEFDDGRDLTFMWSAGLPHDHVFACPLSFWCDRETHWVVRNRRDGLRSWLSERRSLWDDTQIAYGARPAKAVRLWLIANSIFQRNHGAAVVRDLRLVEAGAGANPSAS